MEKRTGKEYLGKASEVGVGVEGQRERGREKGRGRERERENGVMELRNKFTEE